MEVVDHDRPLRAVVVKDRAAVVDRPDVVGGGAPDPDERPADRAVERVLGPAHAVPVLQLAVRVAVGGRPRVGLAQRPQRVALGLDRPPCAAVVTPAAAGRPDEHRAPGTERPQRVRRLRRSQSEVELLPLRAVEVVHHARRLEGPDIVPPGAANAPGDAQRRLLAAPAVDAPSGSRYNDWRRTIIARRGAVIARRRMAAGDERGGREQQSRTYARHGNTMPASRRVFQLTAREPRGQ